MKTVASIEDVRRLALKTGATAVIDGEVFNAGRVQINPKPPALPEPVASVAPPMPPSEPQITRAELEQLLSARDAFWMGEMQRLAATLAMAVPKAKSGWSFTPIYGQGDRLERIEARAT